MCIFHGLLQIPIICLFVIWECLGTLILGWPNSGCSFFLLLTSNSGLQIQLIRIELRVPEYGWTTQKVFHLLNFIVNGGELQWPLFCRHSSLLHAWSKIGFPLIFLYCLLGAVQAAGFSQQNRFCPNDFYIACFGVVQTAVFLQQNRFSPNGFYITCFGAVRAVVFCFRESVQALSPEVCSHVNFLLG
jgi:hypothetical protein